jgi:hypothetical protein
VYVIGAGFSAALGFPTTNDVLVKVWDRLDKPFRKRLSQIIAFHHPDFDQKRRTSFPELEPLLSAIEVNLALFDHTRVAYGKLTPQDVRQASEELLWYVAQWFEEIHGHVREETHNWLQIFCDTVRREGSTIVSFNWDLVLDERLLEDVTAPAQYGFGAKLGRPLVLKPHGSLNWFDESQAKSIKADRKVLLAREGESSIYAFAKFRGPRSKTGKRYKPLIIPPHYMKRFDGPGFKNLWQTCVSELSTADEIVFVGYSLPPSDFHARFMLRCAFHNQIDGIIRAPKSRGVATGPARVVVVNPDAASARRIESITKPQASFQWEPVTARDWAERELG